MPIRITGSISNGIAAKGPDRKPSLLVKNQLRETTVAISSSNIHVILSLSPGKIVRFVPSGGEMIFPKQCK
jgi:hypothetical protein